MSFKPKFRTVSGSEFNSSFGSKEVVFRTSGSSPSTRDHSQLFNRDANNQHPISAIEGLVGVLATKPDTAITNYEILEITTGGN